MTEHVTTHVPLRTGSNDDALLAEVLENYLADVEAGRARPAAELVAEYPHLADRLEACLVSLRFVEQAGIDIRDTAFAKTLEDGGATLGDFRIVREIGRGGMGIVYEAEQQSLRRRVALKILPFAAVLDDRRLQRFKNEALAAGQLKHPNIVSVLSVGCERGVHYYAMEYVEGQSLAEVVEQLRGEQDVGCSMLDVRSNPLSNIQHPASHIDTAPIAALSTLRTTDPRDRFRQIARLGIQAAEALHYAHEIGIVHRDIKPSNLLVDAHGHLWITDFGLATTQTDASLTMTGDLLGTLRYMSPEQAAGDRARIDYRTDIYSLGVTLYELLTRTCAFADINRQVLLRRIIEDAPKPPRSIDSAIPTDLETIVLKATEKEPQARYDSAVELAADLQRFCDERPILARPPTAAYQLQKFVRKNRGPVSAAATMLALLIMALIWAVVGLVRVNREREVATLERDRAEENLVLSQRLIREVLAPASTGLAVVTDDNEVQRIKAEMLEKALQFAEKVIEQKPTDPNTRLELARLCVQLGEMAYWTGEKRELVCRRAVSILEQLVAEFPNNPTYLYELCMAHGYLGRLVWNDLKCSDTLQHWLAGVRVGEQLVSQVPNDPSYQKELYDSHQGAAFGLVARGDLAEAEKHYLEAVKDTQTPSAHYQYADLLMSLNRFAEAEEFLQEGLRIFEHRNPESTSDRVYQSHWIAEFHQGFGRVRSHWGDIDLAENHLKQAIATHETYIRDLSYPSYYLVKLGWSYHHLSQLYVLKEQLMDAEQAARQSLQAWTATEKPIAYQYTGLGHFHLGNLLHWQGRTEEARPHFQRAQEELAALSRVLAYEPYCQTWRILLLSNCPDEEFRDPQLAVELAKQAITAPNALMWRILALCQCRAGAGEDARQSLQKSIQLRGEGDAIDWLLLAMIHWQLDERAEALQWFRKAQEAISTRQPILYGDFGALGFKRLAAEAETTLGNAESQ